MGAGLDEIEAVYRSRLDELCTVAAAILRDRERGRDVVQEAFATAVRRRRDFRGDGPLEAWLWRIVVNTARTARRTRGEATLDPVLDPSRNGHGEPADELQAAIAQLPPRQRLVLFLRYYADLDYDAIARVLEIRPGTVGAALNAAQATLRRTLEEVPR